MKRNVRRAGKAAVKPRKSGPGRGARSVSRPPLATSPDKWRTIRRLKAELAAVRKQIEELQAFADTDFLARHSRPARL